MPRITRRYVLEATSQNLDLAISYFKKYVPGMEIIRDSCVMRRIDLRDRTYNMIINAQFTRQNAAREIDKVIAFFKEKNLPFSWWISPLDRPVDLKERLMQKGLVVQDVDIGMYIDLANFTPSSILPLQCQRASSPAQLESFIDIQASIGRNPDAFEKIYAKLPVEAYTGNSPVGLHLGYAEGKPVVTGMLVMQDRVAGIYFIATAPAERRKRYATKMMRYLLTVAKEAGCEIAVLESSRQGQRLYENLGFLKSDIFIEMTTRN